MQNSARAAISVASREQARRSLVVVFFCARCSSQRAGRSTPCGTSWHNLKVPLTRGGMLIPNTSYAKAGDAAVAYQVYGSGEHRVVAVPGAISNVEVLWEWPPAHYYFERWGSFATVALFDMRGTGCSDRIPGAASVQERIEDFRVVMDTVGWDRATIYGFSEGGPLACLFAATYPERSERLVLQGSFARA